MVLEASNRVAGHRTALAEAKALAGSMPALLVEARRIAATIVSGWHGRRHAGPGEGFWQFRPFVSGEAASMIDWRRSARDEHLYVREREWEAAHTVWLSPDLSASMRFQTKAATTDKQSRAILLTLTLAGMLTNGGERVGLLDAGPSTLSRDAPERIARALTKPARSAVASRLDRFAELILLGDFLDPIEETEQRLNAIAAAGARAHLVQIFDPAEEAFPYSGRIEFTDPETGKRQLIGRAETVADGYRRRLAEHRDRIKERCRRLGWTFLIHHTDRSALEPLLALQARLTDRGSAPATSVT